MLTRADLAKYPFLTEAQDYNRQQGFSIDEIAETEFRPVLDRAEQRLEEALSKGRISSQIQDENTEILSYPVSNLILSLTGEERARKRFALAEAKRAYDLLRLETAEKLEQIATGTFHWKLQRIDVQLGKRFYNFALGLADYLRNNTHLKEPKWKLSNRILDHGIVFVTHEEAARLLEEEVRTRIDNRTARAPVQSPRPLQRRLAQTRAMRIK